MKKCIKCGSELYDEDRFCLNCGQKQELPKVSQQQEPEPEPVMYFDQTENTAGDSGMTDNLVESEASFNVLGIPKGAKCRYCLGPISPENGECLLCHRPYFEKVEDPVEKEPVVEEKIKSIPESDVVKEPRCRYCNGKISQDTGLCLLCGKSYNIKEEDVESHISPKRLANTVNVNSYPKSFDDPYEKIKNSNAQYKEDLEKYGTSAGSYNGNVLFDRVGGKIMGLAKFIFWAIVVINCIIAIYLIYLAVKSESAAPAVIGVFVIAGGILVGWLSSVLLYGYGQLIDSQQETVDELSEIKNLLRQIGNNSLKKK